MIRGKLLGALAALALAAPAMAQIGGTRGESFLKAVQEADGNKATELLDANGSTVVNFRGANGEVALNIVARRRDLNWLAFLLSRGADANASDSRGETPLIISSRLGWFDGAGALILRGARIDAVNRLGETALIAAVQSRQPALVRLLLEQGANPDKTDHAAGLSARDYARRDPRAADILKLIESVKSSKKSVSGPKLN